MQVDVHKTIHKRINSNIYARPAGIWYLLHLLVLHVLNIPLSKTIHIHIESLIIRDNINNHKS
jgi:hypothetical protein